MPRRNNHYTHPVTISWLIGRSVVVCLLLSFCLVACVNDLETVERVTATPDGPFQTSYDSKISYSEMGLNKMEIIAKQLDQYIVDEKLEMEMPQGIEIVFYDSLQNVQSRLTAQKGKFYSKNSKLMVQDSVVFLSENGESLITEELIWWQDSGIVSTEKHVKVIREDGIIYGKGLTAKEDFSNYTIRKITGELYINDSDSTNQ